MGYVSTAHDELLELEDDEDLPADLGLPDGEDDDEDAPDAA